MSDRFGPNQKHDDAQHFADVKLHQVLSAIQNEELSEEQKKDLQELWKFYDDKVMKEVNPV